MIALGVVLLLLVLLLSLPIGMRFRFDGESRVTVRYAGIPVWRYSSEKERQREKKKKKKKKTSEKAASSGQATDVRALLDEITRRLRENGAAAVAAYLRELAGLATATLRRAARIVRFGRCTVAIAVATPDAAETALRYGKLCGVLYPARQMLEHILRIRRLDFAMRPDFLRESDHVQADIRLHAFPVPLIITALKTLISYAGIAARLENSRQRKDVEDG